ncbi:Holliday junction resolvase RecU [Enterococcus asini]|uniref:Holliday junction resolvase RecU n=1 Tax=Enterococcus asini TaxID=57732 RepID=UPI0022E2D4E7|nr:Holliday junction resolvase RecU [Enterococcus asini]
MAFSKKARNRSNTDRGRLFERLVDQACLFYRNGGVAMIEKTPEPFRVVEKYDAGFFKGRFTGHAQPDYKGTLKGGRAIAFEAKMTGTDRIKKSVVTDFQTACMNYHYHMGAYVGVVCMIKNTVAFVPWSDWLRMKELFGRQYILEKELLRYQVPTPGFVDFLRQSEGGAGDAG